MLNISQLQLKLEKQLEEANIAEYKQETRWILQYITGYDQLELLLQKNTVLPSEQLQILESILQRRVKREPLQYILSSQAFLDFDFQVGSGVLIPRPETEELVQHVLNALPETAILNIAEMGCGSGAIAVSLAYYRPKCQVYCSDNSPVALEVTHANARKYHVENRLHLLSGDDLEPFKQEEKKFDLFVSNPPYISLEDWQSLEPEVKLYEPKHALTPGPDPLSFYQLFARELPHILEPDATIWLELDSKHALEVLNLFKSCSSFRETSLHRDLQGNERFLESKYHG